MNPQSGRLIVSAINLCILQSDSGIYQLLGFRSEEIAGSDLRILCGPMTNDLLLELCIKRAHASLPFAVQLILYDRKLVPKKIMVQPLPVTTSINVQPCVLLCLATSKAVLLSDAIEKNQVYPRVLVLPDPPYLMCFINEAFSVTFRNEISLGSTSLCSFVHNMSGGVLSEIDVWSEPLISAAVGVTCERMIRTKPEFGSYNRFKLKCEPVVLSVNSKVGFIAATFVPLLLRTNQNSDIIFSITDQNSAQIPDPSSDLHSGCRLHRSSGSDPHRISSWRLPAESRPIANCIPVDFDRLLPMGVEDPGIAGAGSLVSPREHTVATSARTAVQQGTLLEAAQAAGPAVSTKRLLPSPQHSLHAVQPPRRRAGRPQRVDDVAALLARGDHTLLRRIRRRHAAADRRAAVLGGEGAA